MPREATSTHILLQITNQKQAKMTKFGI